MTSLTGGLMYYYSVFFPRGRSESKTHRREEKGKIALLLKSRMGGDGVGFLRLK